MENILLDPDGHIKLTDFGVACLSDEKNNTDSNADGNADGKGGGSTADGKGGGKGKKNGKSSRSPGGQMLSVVGTPAYMAPEIIMEEP